ncbi:hypothetical protein AVEN_207205-1 [Araneus ventricosus]|uniref:Uncharacterized protein n=1 Tax=Araneus ventricosus TaxID=182803 RepID=A0A4Y2E5E0_ARAVE|nr:hypothetical protein AVEN_207205-1 [Araneus ventricosus]
MNEDTLEKLRLVLDSNSILSSYKSIVDTGPNTLKNIKRWHSDCVAFAGWAGSLEWYCSFLVPACSSSRFPGERQHLRWDKLGSKEDSSDIVGSRDVSGSISRLLEANGGRVAVGMGLRVLQGQDSQKGTH